NMQRKLVKQLIIQTLFPIGLLGVPVSVYCASTGFNMFSTRTCLIFVCIQSTHSLVHSSLVIILNDAYRNTIRRWFGKIVERRNSTSSMLVKSINLSSYTQREIQLFYL
ncbi:hypothetical protein PMAYCL1PPCAC_05923, partial [Pristionchus mayeri]